MDAKPKQYFEERFADLNKRLDSIDTELRALRGDIRSARKDIKGIHGDLIAHDERANELIVRMERLESANI